VKKVKFIDLLPTLPPVIARSEVPKLLGGVVSAKTLANADCELVGPEGKLRVGRKVAYITESLLEWLDNRVTNENFGE